MKNRMYFAIILLFFSNFSFGQNVKKDSLMKKMESEVYQNPDNAIKMANSMLKNESDIDKKIPLILLISNAYVSKRNFDESLKYILKAKEMADATPNIRKKILVLISIAVQYQQMELFNKSLETLDNADIALESLRDDQQEFNYQSAKSLAIRGMIYKSQGNSEIALQKFLLSVKSFEKTKKSQANLSNLSIVNYNIGYCFINLKDAAHAIEYFEKSKILADEANAKSLQAFALKGLAETYVLNENREKATQLLEEAEKISQNVGDLVLIEGINKGLSDNYLFINNAEKYQYYFKKYQAAKFEREQSELKSINRSIDSHSAENKTAIQQIQSKFKVKKALILSTGIVAIFTLLYFIRKKRRENKIFQREIQNMI